MDASYLDHDFDEEALGFGEPETLPELRPGLSWDQRGALAVLGVGILVLLAQLGGGAGAGTWPGLGLSWGLIGLGIALTSWRRHAGQTEGIHHDGIQFASLTSRGALGWLAGILMTGLYVLIYWYPELLGERSATADGQWTQLDPVGLVATVDPLARLMTGAPASRWFLYGVLYTGAILVFGVRMLLKYRGNPYQQLRTTSVVVAQLLLAWLLPNLLVLFQQPYMEFNGVWPLKQNYLWPEKLLGEFAGAKLIGLLLIAWAVGMVVATPVLTYFFGKRWYCSWVCGCGGLAETLGDPWRQLSDKSTRAWKLERWMIHGVLLLVLGVTASLWIDHASSGALYGSWSSGVRSWYGFYIGAVFSGVVGVGFYPLLGSRVWCRFGCPQAAILGLWQRLFSRFRITTNGDQCMSCGNCSTFCEMGIDVRSYAEKGENVVRASCVGCGVCASVCPRGVLKLENGSTHADRYPGADTPLATALHELTGEARRP